MDGAMGEFFSIEATTVDPAGYSRYLPSNILAPLNVRHALKRRDLVASKTFINFDSHHSEANAVEFID
jgi:hypothetical protein